MSMIATGLNPKLDLRHADGTRLMFRRPMCGMDGAKAIVGDDEDAVLAEVACGRIRWAFNLGTGDKVFPLFLVRSLVCYLEPHLPQPETFEQLIEAVLPPLSIKTGNLRNSDLRRYWNISSEHGLNLIRSGLLQESRRSDWHQGRNGSPTVTRESAVQLLKTRRIL
jgi:hypothetical protein